MTLLKYSLISLFGIIALCLVLIIGFPVQLQHALYSTFPQFTHTYYSNDQNLLSELEQSAPADIGWTQLVPEKEREILRKFQQPTVANLTEQILLSIEASTNTEYRDAMYSTNIIPELIGQWVNISGFLVPLELDDNRNIRSFFLVPYFGACTHYPPPPPNQMLYVRVSANLPMPDLNQAYTLTGVLSDGLYEDMLGTSAYQLALAKMKPFTQNPDDFRQH